MIGAKGVPATIGGIERHVEELSARLASGGFDVTVYCRSWYTGFASWSAHAHRGARLVTLPSFASKHLDAMTHTLLATIHACRERHDVYHFHGVGPALMSWIPRLLRPHARVIATFHCVDRHHAKWGWFARAVLALGEWAACRFPHETITVGETLAAYCEDRYGRATACIPNGVAAPARVPPDVARDILASLGLTSRRYLLIVSRLVPHKGIHTVIEAFRRLKMEHRAFRDVQLAIVGSPAFTSAYADELVIRAGGDPAILFLGRRTGIVLDALYQHATAFVHASESEGHPIAVLEAAAAGAIPVLSDIPEHREIVARVGGFCFRTRDVYDCAATLEVVLRGASSLPRIGRAVSEATLRHYDWDAATGRTVECYRRSPLVTPLKARGVGELSLES